MKRRLIIVAIFLLAGAVVNVGVAWGCALWSDTRPPTIVSERRGFGFLSDPPP